MSGVTEVIGYLRVSTDEQARGGLGLEAQREAITRAAEHRGWSVRWVTDEGYSAKNLNRPALQQALAGLENGGPKVLVVAKLDRISRSALDFLGLVDRAQHEGWALVVLDLDLDMTTPMGRFTATVMAGVAELERSLISQRTREALAAAKAQGKRLGGPRKLPDATLRRVVRLREQGNSLQKIADRLNAEGVPTAKGATWNKTTVARALRSHALDLEARRARERVGL
jgi:DNA invertase Pin-like site-specific DNA recombinase